MSIMISENFYDVLDTTTLIRSNSLPTIFDKIKSDKYIQRFICCILYDNILSRKLAYHLPDEFAVVYEEFLELQKKLIEITKTGIFSHLIRLYVINDLEEINAKCYIELTQELLYVGYNILLERREYLTKYLIYTDNESYGIKGIIKNLDVMIHGIALYSEETINQTTEIIQTIYLKDNLEYSDIKDNLDDIIENMYYKVINGITTDEILDYDFIHNTIEKNMNTVDLQERFNNIKNLLKKYFKYAQDIVV